MEAAMASSMERTARYRERQRRLGLRQVELWVWDTRHPDVQAMLARNVEIMRARAGNAEEQAVVAEIEAFTGEILDQIEAGEEAARRQRAGDAPR
jgi:antidote-toxin recognition MazE-like antitoxin